MGSAKERLPFVHVVAIVKTLKLSAKGRGCLKFCAGGKVIVGEGEIWEGEEEGGGGRGREKGREGGEGEGGQGRRSGGGGREGGE